MSNLNIRLDLGKIPEIVGRSGNELLRRCYNVLDKTRWPIYIVGPSGSGKSVIAMNIAKRYSAARNVPAFYVQLSPEQTKTSLILGLRLDGGSLVVKNGIVAECMEEGGVIVVDEATHSLQEVLLMFNSILDRTSVTAIGDKIVYAHENFRILFCANDSQYSGNIKLPQSFAQRLVCFYFDYPAAEDELSIVDRIIADEYMAPDRTPREVKKYIIDLMREMRSKTYPLSVRNAAIATVMCNLELPEDEKAAASVTVNDYFIKGNNVESVRRAIAERLGAGDVENVAALNSPEMERFVKFVSLIGVERFKEIILQSFMYYLDVDLGFYDLQLIKDKIQSATL
ncbi:MAG: AAA family ATPase [Acidaminococcales bacterium]|jgi:MoxR-like ATPase|nr:AAA family ATPase [Acidaminococcales bacterium]